MVGAEAPGLVWQSVSLSTGRTGSQGLQAWKGPGNTGRTTWEFSAQATFPLPPPAPSQHCPFRWLSLLAKCRCYLKVRNLPAERGLGSGPHLLQRGQGSGKQAQGLGKQAIKAAPAIPSGHGGERAAGSQLNIGTLGGGSGSCQPQGAAQFLLTGGAGMRPAGTVFVRTSSERQASPW